MIVFQESQKIDAGGFERTTLYDQVSRPVQVNLPDGGQENYVYDNLSNVLTKTTKVNSTETMISSFTYNKIYQLIDDVKDDSVTVLILFLRL